MAAFEIGTITYDIGVARLTFPENAQTELIAQPEMDGSGRTIKYTNFTLTVKAYIHKGFWTGSNGNTVDFDFERVRKVLSKPAGKLTIQRKGAGNIGVNPARTDGYFRDVEYGPFPKLVRWVPLGNVTCYVEWQVSWKMPDCTEAQFVARFMEFVWRARFQIDGDGLTIRTISGYATIPANRLGAHAESNKPGSYDNIDQMRREIIVECPLGFVRDSQSFTVNEARNRIDFETVDRQLDHAPFPPGISDMQVDWDLDISGQIGHTFEHKIFTFAGWAKAALNQPKTRALRALIDEHNYRFAFVLQNLMRTNGIIVPFPLRYHVRERTRGRGSRVVQLTIVWNLTIEPGQDGRFLPANLLDRLGFFRSPEGNPTAWRNSMAPGGPLDNYGHAGLQVQWHSDFIVDLCGKKEIGDIGDTSNRFTRLVDRIDGPPIVTIAGEYYDYSIWLDAIGESGTVTTVPINPGQTAANIDKPDIDRYWYRFHGFAYRYEQQVEIPRLNTLRGQRLHEFGQSRITHRKVATISGLSIWYAEWEIKYRLGNYRGNAPGVVDIGRLTNSSNLAPANLEVPDTINPQPPND